MSKVILVTGSNSSIGYELVRLLAEKGHVVYLGARNEVAGKEAEETLHKQGLTNVKFILLDVTILATIESAREAIKKAEGKLDVLVNNAAIARSDSNQNPSVIPLEAIQDVYNTNVFGLIQTTTTFIPLLRKSSLPIILNVSSGLGSSTLQSKPGARRVPFIAYQSSKAAVNSYTVGLAQELRDEGFKINAVTPGMVASRINNFIAGGKSLEEGARALVPYALLDANGPTGKFFNWEGEEVPW